MKQKHHIKRISLYLITFLLVLLWAPVAIDKQWDVKSFHYVLLQQPIPNWWADILFWLLPILESGIVVLLAWPKRRFQYWGMLLSTILLTVFTIYIALGLLNVFEQRPCGCGSVITHMTWEQHFWFNLFFLFLSGTGTFLTFLQRNNHMQCEVETGWVGQTTDIN